MCVCSKRGQSDVFFMKRLNSEGLNLPFKQMYVLVYSGLLQTEDFAQ